MRNNTNTRLLWVFFFNFNGVTSYRFVNWSIGPMIFRDVMINRNIGYLLFQTFAVRFGTSFRNFNSIQVWFLH